MYKHFEDAFTAAKKRGRKTVSVAVAQDLDVLKAVKAAVDAGLATPLLVGDETAIRPLAKEAGLPDDVRIVHETDQDQAALIAVDSIRKGEAQILMKGLINSSNFLKAVLNKEKGLRKSKVLSHLGIVEIKGNDRLIFSGDGGMNVAPDLDAKKEILINMLDAMKNMGLTKPNVAALSHNEQVNEKMPSTTDAAGLVAMAAAGELPPCVIEGPIAMDVAISPEAAKHKKIDSQISGKVDVWLFPNIETGNIMTKALIYYADAKFAGLVLGATHPIVLVSRSDTPETKLASIAMACLSAPE